MSTSLGGFVQFEGRTVELFLFERFCVITQFLPLSVLTGPAAICQRSQCFVPLTLSAQHAQQSGARTAALEEAGPGAEEVCV